MKFISAAAILASIIGLINAGLYVWLSAGVAYFYLALAKVYDLIKLLALFHENI